MNSFVSPQTLTTLPFPPAADDLYSRVLDAILEQRIHEASRFTEKAWRKCSVPDAATFATC